jgi:tryptophan-rich sensory protein
MAIEILKLIVSIALCQLAGFISALFNIKSIPKWYSKLKKPRFNPPNKIFGPVWTGLYLLMGISLYLVLVSGIAFGSFPIIIFFVHLLLNVLWSAIFFRAKKLGLAFLEIIVLWISISVIIILFYPISHLASYLLIPYLLWVSFASLLNWKFWRLNRKRG